MLEVKHDDTESSATCVRLNDEAGIALEIFLVDLLAKI